MLAGAATVAAAPAPLAKFDGLAISSDGRRVASVDTLQAADSAVPDSHGQVIVRNARSGAVEARYDPCAVCTYGGLTWSRDGQLAFIASDPVAGTAALVVTAGQLRTIATIEGVAQTPRWSPDGQRLAFLAVFGAHKAVGAIEAGRAQVGEIGEAEDEQRIVVVDAAGGAAKPVSQADTWVYEYDWKPDGSGFVATAAKGNGDNNWWVAKLVQLDMDGRAVTLVAPEMQIAAPHVGPDGRVWFIGGLMSDFGSTGGDLYAVPAAGGEPVDLTPGARFSVTSLVTTPRTGVVTRQAGDRVEIARVAADGAMTVVWSGPVAATAGATDSGVAVADDGRTLATVVSDFAHPAEILAGTGDRPALKAITTANAGHPAYVAARSVTWTSEGRAVQGWLLTPLGGPAGAKRPMVVDIHGGPSAFAGPQYLWNGVDRALIDHGYAVFKPNPRGSYGQGEAFTRANVRDFGGGDLRDILAGVDAVVADGSIDGARLGVFGHSYGGFMTMWTVTHTARFKAAVAGAGIANWISYYGENGIDQWMIPFFGASAYDDPAVYVAASPLTTIKAARTPTLIYVGERDVECPAPQSVEFWHGLKAVGVPTKLIIYEGAGHRLRKPEQIHDREDQTVAWFDRWLK